MTENSPDAQKSDVTILNDVIYGLLIQTKYIAELLDSYESGTRTQKDFQDRFHSQSHLFATQLAKVKPLIESVYRLGYSKFKVDEDTIGSNIQETIQSSESESMD